jgi:hypothetical protein
MRRAMYKRYLGAWAAIGCLIGCIQLLRAQDAPEVQSKFTDLRDDNIPGNCSAAVAWLYPRRDQLKDAMLDELYRTDRQGRDALLDVLFVTPSLVPDGRFLHLVVSRLAEEDKYVGNFAIDTNALGEGVFYAGYGSVPICGTHWLAWKYIDGHFDLFEPLLAAQISDTTNLCELWGATWIFKKHDVLAKHIELYTPEVLRRVSSNLADDKVRFNASQAARIFLLLGDAGIPELRVASRSADAQESSLAQALLDALGGSKQAFGFLYARLSISRTLFGVGKGEPEWLSSAGAPYFENPRRFYP